MRSRPHSDLLGEGSSGGRRQPRRPGAGSVFVGALVGGVIGAIIAVNVVIYSGAERGYETTLPDLLRESTLIALLALVILIAGPVIGALWAQRKRDGRPK